MTELLKRWNDVIKAHEYVSYEIHNLTNDINTIINIKHSDVITHIGSDNKSYELKKKVNFCKHMLSRLETQLNSKQEYRDYLESITNPFTFEIDLRSSITTYAVIYTVVGNLHIRNKEDMDKLITCSVEIINKPPTLRKRRK